MWAAIRTVSRTEFDACADLARVTESYCPVVNRHVRLRHGHGRRIVRSYPRFSTYIFRRIDEPAALGAIFAAVRRSRRLIDLVRFGDVVATLDDAQVALLRSYDDVAPQEPVPIQLSCGDKILITCGALQGKSGYVTRIASARIDIISSPSTLRARVPLASIAPV